MNLQQAYVLVCKCVYVVLMIQPDFAVEFLQYNIDEVSGNFLADRGVNYFEGNKCTKMLNCATVGKRNRFQLQNPV